MVRVPAVARTVEGRLEFGSTFKVRFNGLLHGNNEGK